LRGKTLRKLIGNQDARTYRQPSRKSQHLLLASGQSARPLRLTVPQCREDGKGPLDAGPLLTPIREPPHGEPQVLANRQVRKHAATFRDVSEAQALNPMGGR
jgi:hypothetical protein